jgi:hypothetical protein
LNYLFHNLIHNLLEEKALSEILYVFQCRYGHFILRMCVHIYIGKMGIVAICFGRFGDRYRGFKPVHFFFVSIQLLIKYILNSTSLTLTSHTSLNLLSLFNIVSVIRLSIDGRDR